MQHILTALKEWLLQKQKRFAPLVAWLRSPRGRRLVRLLGYLVMAVVVLFLALTLAASWQQIQPYLATMNMRLVLWAQLCTLVAYLLGGLLWLVVLRAFDIHVSWQWGLMTHLIANAAKYVPGYGWQYISKGVLLREQGKGPRALSTILLTEVMLLLSSGVAAALWAGALVGQVWAYTWRFAPWIWWSGFVCVVIGTGVWNHFAQSWVGALHVASLPNSVKNPAHIVNKLFEQRLLWVAWLIGFVGWLWFAAATLLLVNALDQITNSLTIYVEFLHSLFALVASGIVSILVIIVPGGFGVREATLATLLNGLLPLPVATVVSIFMRLVVIVSECVGFIWLPFLLRYRSTRVNRL